jgi:hypothetical protein
MLIKGGK